MRRGRPFRAAPSPCLTFSSKENTFHGCDVGGIDLAAKAVTPPFVSKPPMPEPPPPPTVLLTMPVGAVASLIPLRVHAIPPTQDEPFACWSAKPGNVSEVVEVPPWPHPGVALR
jgi:hypothetical protein